MTRALRVAVACCLMLVFAASASAASFPVASPEFVSAVQVAERQWGGLPCGGRIAFGWRDEDPDVNATSYWYPGYTDCEVVFNRRANMSWTKFCTIMAHELGHLHGRGHSGDPDDLMSPFYSRPLPACGASGSTSAAPAEGFEEEAPTDPEALRGVRMTKRQLARLRAARMCNRRQTRRAVRRCKRTMARRTARRRQLARSVTVSTPATPPASHP